MNTNPKTRFVTMVNSLANMLIDSASKGYVSSNDLDFANDCLDKVIPLLADEDEECHHVWYIDPSDYDSEVCAECGDRRN